MTIALAAIKTGGRFLTVPRNGLPLVAGLTGGGKGYSLNQMALTRTLGSRRGCQLTLGLTA